MEMVVVMGQRLDDLLGALQAERGTDVDPGRARADEAIHQVLGELDVDLLG
jgi:hypothetical protein